MLDLESPKEPRETPKTSQTDPERRSRHSPDHLRRSKFDLSKNNEHLAKIKLYEGLASWKPRVNPKRFQDKTKNGSAIMEPENKDSKS